MLFRRIAGSQAIFVASVAMLPLEHLARQTFFDIKGRFDYAKPAGKGDPPAGHSAGRGGGWPVPSVNVPDDEAFLVLGSAFTRPVLCRFHQGCKAPK